MLDQAFQRLPGEIEAVECGIAALERGHDAQRLGVVIEAAEGGEAVVERALAGMAERRMAEIVRKRQRLGEILVEPERARERARDLGDFERVGEPRAVVIALVEDEDLRLVLEAAKGGRMDDAVAVAAEGAAALGSPAPDGAGRGSAPDRTHRRARGAAASIAIGLGGPSELTLALART